MTKPPSDIVLALNSDLTWNISVGAFG